MLQSEVGSAKLTPAHSFPARGRLMCDFTLPSAEGGQVSLYDYRGHANLVLFFAGDAADLRENGFLRTLVQRYAEIRGQDSEILVVLACSREQAERAKHQVQLPFPVLADQDRQIHKSVGAVDVHAVPASAVYVTDRFLEVYATWRTAQGDNLPGVSEVLSWLAYIESECPECTQAEWPRDD